MFLGVSLKCYGINYLKKHEVMNFISVKGVKILFSTRQLLFEKRNNHGSPGQTGRLTVHPVRLTGSQFTGTDHMVQRSDWLVHGSPGQTGQLTGTDHKCQHLLPLGNCYLKRKIIDDTES
jgi:hypothetical protein